MKKNMYYRDTQDVNSMTFNHIFMPICNSAGELKSIMMLIFLDREAELRKNIDEMHRKNAEMETMQIAIQNEKSSLQAVMNAVDSTLLRVTYDVDCAMIDINDYTVAQYGVPREQLLGKKITDKMPPEEVAAFKASWEKMLNGEPMKGEGNRMVAAGIKRIWYIYSPIMDTSGKAAKVLMIGQIIE